VTSAVVIGFAFMVGYYGTPFLYSLYLQQIRGLSTVVVGVVFIPMALIGGVLNPLSARIVQRIGLRITVITGLIAMITGMLALAFAPAHSPAWVLAILLVLVGIGGPAVMPPTMAALLDSVDAHRAGTAGGVFNASRQLGVALAIAIFGALLTADGFDRGLRISLFIGVAVTLFAALTARRLRQEERG
jgi:MFS transporter, DHA2 family, methylenomycin A resistance protein